MSYLGLVSHEDRNLKVCWYTKGWDLGECGNVEVGGDGMSGEIVLVNYC